MLTYTGPLALAAAGNDGVGVLVAGFLLMFGTA